MNVFCFLENALPMSCVDDAVNTVIPSRVSVVGKMRIWWRDANVFVVLLSVNSGGRSSNNNTDIGACVYVEFPLTVLMVLKVEPAVSSSVGSQPAAKNARSSASGDPINTRFVRSESLWLPLVAVR